MITQKFAPRFVTRTASLITKKVSLKDNRILRNKDAKVNLTSINNFGRDYTLSLTKY